MEQDILETISLGDFIRSYIPNFRGDSLLHEAVHAGRRDLCEFLIRIRRMDVNAINRMGLSPLYCAVRGGNDDICELLRDHGACFRFASDAGQQTLGDRAPFFRRLRTCMEYIRHLVPESELIQFYHRDCIPGGDFYVACSVESPSDTMPIEMSTALAYLIVDAKFIDQAAWHIPQKMTQSDLVFVPYAIKYNISAIGILPIHHMDDLVGTFVVWLRSCNVPKISTQVLWDIIFDRIESIHDMDILMRGTFESEVSRCLGIVESSLDSVQFLKPALFLNRAVGSGRHPILRRARSVLRYLWMMHVPISGASTLYDRLSWIDAEPIHYIHDIVDRIMMTEYDAAIPKTSSCNSLSCKDVFDIIGRRADNLREMTSALNSIMPIDATVDHLLSVAEIIMGAAKIRTTGSVGLVDTRTYRVFAPPGDILPILRRCLDDAPAISGIDGLFRMHTAVLQCAHPFNDGNGRIMRAFSTMIGRSIGYNHMLIPSHSKTPSFAEFRSFADIRH